MNPTGAAKDYKSAITYFNMAAKSNHLDSIFNLGDMYQNAKGVPKNTQTAIKWFKKAVTLGSTDADFRLGHLYTIQRNFIPALACYKNLADRGNAEAQYKLAKMYELGQGCPINMNLALDWANKSSDKGYHQAKELVKKLLAAGNQTVLDYVKFAKRK
jgi:TPR repeat protein